MKSSPASSSCACAARRSCAQATQAVTAARDTGRGALRRSGASGADLLAAQAYLERAERDRREAALDLDRQDAEVEARRRALTAAARERQAIGSSRSASAPSTTREVARREQIDLDEVALGVHRRGRVAA